MHQLASAIDVLQPLVFAVLAAASIVSAARGRRVPGRWWVPVPFVALCVMASGSHVLPSVPESVRFAAVDLIWTAAVAFPVALYRFTRAFETRLRGVRHHADLIGAGAVLMYAWTAPPGDGTARSALVQVTFVAVLWTILCTAAAMTLWRSGSAAPRMARRRMRVLAVAAAVLNLELVGILLIGRGNIVVSIAWDVAAIVAAGALWLGIAMPRPLRLLWREPDLLRYRAATEQLARAATAEEVGEIVVSHAAPLFGGLRAELAEAGGRVLAVRVAAAARREGVVTHAVTTERCRLTVDAGPFTPFFGAEELSLLESMATSADLALGRITFLQRERSVRSELERRRRRLADAERVAGMGSYTWRPATHEVSWSDELHRLLGFAPGTVEDHAAAFLSRIHPEDVERVVAVWNKAAEGWVGDIDFRVVLDDGSVRSLEGSVRGVDGASEGVIGTVRDVTEQRRVAASLERLAFHDPLTGLANRTALAAHLDRLLAAGCRPAVLFLDLDGFKRVNDGLGHAVGDQLLEAIAGRLLGCVDAADVVARFGGDEFVVAIAPAADADAAQVTAVAEGVAARILSVLSEPVAVGGHTLAITASVGIVVADEAHAGTEDLLRDADATMYLAKERGRGRSAAFHPSLRARNISRLADEAALRRAIEQDELVLHHQPQLDVGARRIVGVEALVRWDDPVSGLLGPDSFLPLAEESRLVIPLGEWVLDAAAADAASWQRALGGRPACTTWVNLSARQIAEPGLVCRVSSALRANGTDPDGFGIEITEAVLLSDVDAASKVLEELRELGIHLAIDDFGTGFSSLSWLRGFPVEALKIDRSFVSGLGRGGVDDKLVPAMVNLAHALGLVAVAEGVELPGQLAAVAAAGCDIVQGYLTGPPAPAAAISPLVISAAQHGPRVLLVDDDAVLRRALRTALQMEGAVVLEAGDADGGLELAGTEPDAVLLDVRMPHRSGADVVRSIRGRCPQARLLLMTSDPQDSLRRSAAADGADEVLDKVDGLDRLVAQALATPAGFSRRGPRAG